MPKRTKDFPERLSVDVSEEMRIKLIAIGYMTGNGGEYATPVRNLLHTGIKEYLQGLEQDPRRWKEFQDILANVRIRETKILPGENQKAPVV